jgi:hypothetical protein
MDSDTTRTSQTRIVNTYAELWDGATFLYEQVLVEKRGSYWKLMSCAVLTAFTMEAYLNHIGPTALVGQWNNWFEQKHSPLQKLEMICEKHGVSFPAKQRPRLTIEALFRFRKAVAHGRSETLTPPDVIESLDQISDPFASLPPATEWEKYCSNIENIQHAREDVEQIILSIHRAVKPKGDPPFSKGYTTHTTTISNVTNSPHVPR